MKIAKYIVIFFCVFACDSADSDRPKKPDNLISKEQMAEVLYDMALLSSAKGVGKRTLENTGINPEIFVFEKHNIDSLQFKLSNAYYAYDIEEYESIYEQVKQKLEQDKKGFQTILDEEKRKRDSIAKRNRKQDSLAKLKRNRTRGDSLNRVKTGRLSKDDKSQL